MLCTKVYLKFCLLVFEWLPRIFPTFPVNLTRSAYRKCRKMVLFIVMSQCNQIVKIEKYFWIINQRIHKILIILDFDDYELLCLKSTNYFFAKIGLSTLEQWSLPNSWKEFARFFSKKAKKMRFRNKIYMSAASSVNWNVRIFFSLLKYDEENSR